MSFALNIEACQSLIAPHFELDSKELEGFKAEFELESVPALERRRLSNASKCLFTLASKFEFAQKPLIIFSSHKGEINRCFELLQSLREDFISPTSFSLSVLNATPALLAIMSANTNEILSLSASLSLEYALLNAYVNLRESKLKSAFVVTYYEKLDLEKKHSQIDFFMLALKVSLEKPNFSLSFEKNLNLKNHKNSGANAQPPLNSNLNISSSKDLNTNSNTNSSTSLNLQLPPELSDLNFLSAYTQKKSYQMINDELVWTHEFL